MRSRHFCRLLYFLPMIVPILEWSLCSCQKRVIGGEEVPKEELEKWNFLVAIFLKDDRQVINSN